MTFILHQFFLHESCKNICCLVSGPSARKADIAPYIRSTGETGRPYACDICGKEFVRRDHVVNHLEAKHFPNSNAYGCVYCGDMFNTRNKMYKHVFKIHKENC